MPPEVLSRRRAAFLWAGVGILAAGMLLRLLNLLVLPLFVDEATHIYRAQRILLSDAPFLGINGNKWLFPYLVHFLQPLGPEGPFVARWLAALWAGLSISAALALGKQLDGPSGGLLAGAVYALLPLAVWHERQALVDPMLAALTSLSLLLAVRITLRPDRAWLAAVLALTLAGAYLTKLAALPFFSMPLLLPLLLHRRSPQWRRALAFNGAAIAGAALFLFGFFRLLMLLGYTPAETHSASARNLLLFRLNDPEAVALIQSNFRDYADILISYLGPAVLAAALLTPVWIVQDKRRWELLALLIPAFAFAGLPLFADPVTGDLRLPARYMLTQALPAAVLAAISLRLLLERLLSQAGPVGAPAGAAIVVLTLIPGLLFGLRAVSDPLSARLSEQDADQYFNDMSGYGRLDAIQALKDQLAAEPGTRINIMARALDTVWLHAYLGPRSGWYEVLYLTDERADEQRGRVAAWLAAGDAVYYFGQDERSPIPPRPHDALLEEVGVFPVRTAYAQKTFRLYRVSGAVDALAADMYRNLAGDPAFMGDDYDALAAAMAADPPQQVFIFPSEHAESLAQRLTGVEVSAFDVPGWPISEAEAAGALNLALNAQPGRRIDAVLVNQAASDPQRVVQRALEEQLYRLGPTQWFGLLGRTRYISGPPTPQLEPVGASFEGVIYLEAASPLPSDAAPSDILPLAFRWRTDEPINDDFAIFLHLIDAEGNLAAQYDAQPGGGLNPTTSWPVDVPVADRFALSLPGELAPGRYCAVIGLYNPASGLRLRLTAPETNNAFELGCLVAR